MKSRLLGPLGPALAAAGGVGLGYLYINEGWILPAIIIVILVVLVFAAFLLGKARLREHPAWGSRFMETGYLLLLIGAAAAGAVLFWVAVEKAPAKDAPALTSETYTGLVGALTAYLGAVIIKLETPWNPVKKGLKGTFKSDFLQRRDDIEKDAADAVALESFGARHPGEQVEGWGWDARRLRSRQIQRAVDAGYLKS